jgi:hypothetical protein
MSVINLSNLSLTNLSNLSLSLILNQILSHGSYTKDNSQPDVQHHQHMPLPSMHQDHQHTITRHVSQPCTKACNKPSICTIPKFNRVPQHVHQPCTKTCIEQCINHAPQLVPNRASTMHLNNVHQHLCHTMYHNMCQPCTSTIYHITLNHAMYHKIRLMYMPISQICTSNNEP